MKEKLSFVLLICAAYMTILNTGCDKRLDIANPNAVEERKFWTNESEALIGLYGIFDAYQVAEMTGVRYSEIDHLSDNATTITNQYGWQDIESSNHLSANPRILARWRAYYTIINRANVVISSVKSMSKESIDDNKRARIIAEAKFLRGYVYLDLTLLWGAVPFYLEAQNAFDAGLSRTSKNEIRAYMINELKNDVIPYLPAEISGTERGRISSDAAKALLGKYYLYNEQWPEAAIVLKEIIDEGRYSLHPDYADLFTLNGEFSSENLWEINFETGGIDNSESFSIQVDTMLAAVRPKSHWRPLDNFANSFLCIDGKPIAASAVYGSASPLYILANASTGRYNNRDPRLKASIFTVADQLPSGKPLWNFVNKSANAFSAANNFAVKKYFMLTSTQYNGGPQNYYMIRYADVLLMYAEAKNESLSAPDQTIYDAVNLIRRRLKVKENLSGGKGAISGSVSNMPTDIGMTFNLNSSIVLKTVNINVPQNAQGTVTVKLQDVSGTTLNSKTINIVTAGTAATMRVITLPLYFNINAGNDFKLLLSADVPVGKENSAAYPFNLVGAGSLTGSFPSSGTGYNYLYHWQYDIPNATLTMPDYPAGLTKEQMRQYIRDERRWEFGFEHSRYFDLLRWHIADVILPGAANAKKFTNPRDYLWPYPQEEMDTNPAMRQDGQNENW
jgi:hypothetical protein